VQFGAVLQCRGAVVQIGVVVQVWCSAAVVQCCSAVMQWCRLV